MTYTAYITKGTMHELCPTISECSENTRYENLAVAPLLHQLDVDSTDMLRNMLLGVVLWKQPAAVYV